MAVTIELDITKLSKNKIQEILVEMIDLNIIYVALIDAVRDEIEKKSADRSAKVNGLIKKHFDKYDDVFRALA